MSEFRNLKTDLLKIRADRIIELEAEIAKLRAALEAFACTCREGSSECAWGKGEDKCINYNARAALHWEGSND